MKNTLTKILLAVLSLSLIFTCCGCGAMAGDKSDTVDSETGTTQDDTSSDLAEDNTSAETSESPEEDPDLINQWREDYNFGTCKTLSGNVSVILFYIDDFESSWTDEETDRFTKNEVEPGLLFLEQEAKKYGVELDMTVEKSYSSIYYKDEVITSVANTGLASADVLWQAATQINYTSSTKMIDSFRNEYKTDEIVCLTMFNKSGTSYALNPTRDADYKIDEHCIVFSRELNSTQNSRLGLHASVVAHEILHLYGAEDLYVGSSRERLAKKHYPGDIMLSAKYDINENTVRDATAFYVGWTDSVPDVIKQKGW